MKKLLLLVIILSSFGAKAQDSTVVYQHENVYFLTTVPGLGEKKVERLAVMLSTYLSAIEDNKYDTWYASLSDSTIARINPALNAKKFQTKFNRFREYGIDCDSIRVLSVKKLPKALDNEVGTQYELIIDFGKDLTITNRVSHDSVKASKDRTNPRLFGVDVIVSEKDFKICLHQYEVEKENKNKND
ncbi:MAG: hypothetical protein QE487_01550 [Fluviicola sp.]|nr:hypothetical protein [Fluviicola sp.]